MIVHEHSCVCWLWPHSSEEPHYEPGRFIYFVAGLQQVQTVQPTCPRDGNESVHSRIVLGFWQDHFMGIKLNWEIQSIFSRSYSC